MIIRDHFILFLNVSLAAFFYEVSMSFLRNREKKSNKLLLNVNCIFLQYNS